MYAQRWLAQLFILLILNDSFAQTAEVVYRWGGNADGQALIDKGIKIENGYRLTRENILDAVNFDIKSG